jgi:hypothetical protein
LKKKQVLVRLKEIVRWGGKRQFVNLERRVMELASLAELKKVFGWGLDPLLDDPSIYKYEYLEDANERRVRDAEALGSACRNAPSGGVLLEIGTADGHGTALMASNAPGAKIVTVNILPEEIASGKGGKHTTIALEKEKIGAYYRERGCTNVEQVLANTAAWEPKIGPIDLAFVDGCHDEAFVYNDSVKILKHLRPGSFILWHDFNPRLAKVFPWIGDVCRAVERLYDNGLLSERIFIIRDSWTGVCRIDKKGK